MARLVAVLLTLTWALGMSAVTRAPSLDPGLLLDRGVAEYQAGDFEQAVVHLEGAVDMIFALKSDPSLSAGALPVLKRLDTAFVYLTLAHSRLGHRFEARKTVVRLSDSHRGDSQGWRLPAGGDAAEFASIASKLVPGWSVRKSAGPSAAHAHSSRPGPAPAARKKEASARRVEARPEHGARPVAPPKDSQAPASSAPTVPAGSSMPDDTDRAKPDPAELVPVNPVEPVPSHAQRVEREPVPPEPVQTERSERSRDTERERMIEEALNRERARLQKESEERITGIQRAAEERVAQARRDAQAQIEVMQAQIRRNYLLSLRQADAMATSAKLQGANDIYSMIASSPDAPREILAEAAVGLYRTGAFALAVNAFRRLAPFGKGEADLRYYNAVALYETGDYVGARQELGCALPNIEVTAEVNRYREKIERTSAEGAR